MDYPQRKRVVNFVQVQTSLSRQTAVLLTNNRITIVGDFAESVLERHVLDTVKKEFVLSQEILQFNIERTEDTDEYICFTCEVKFDGTPSCPCCHRTYDVDVVIKDLEMEFRFAKECISGTQLISSTGLTFDSE